MIFEELVMDNFGIYKGRHTINLIPKTNSKDKKPIILFGALNGSGKTTLVDALQLVLYGKFAAQSCRESLAYTNYLESVINKDVDPKEGATIELSMRIQRHQRDENIRLCRFWRKNGQGIKENFEVIRDGSIDAFATEHWDEVVEEIMPKGIAHLFFFDGERIEQLADSDHAANIIETGLHALLGLDLIDRLTADLTFVERRRKKDILNKVEHEKLQKKEVELGKLQQEVDELYQELGSSNNKLQQLEKRHQQLQDKYNKSGGRLFDSRKNLDIELKASEEQLNNLSEQLKDIASKSAPLLLVQDLLNEVRNQVNREEALNKTKEMSHILQNRDRLLIRHLRSGNVSDDIINSLDKYLKNDREKRLKGEVINVFLEISNKYLSHVSDENLDHISSLIRALVNKASEVINKIERIEEQITAIPSEEQLGEVIEQIDAVKQDIAKQQNTVDLSKKQYNASRVALEKMENELESLLEQNLEIDIANEKNTRIIKHTKKVQETLKIFRRAVADKHIHVLESLILESFQQLIRKSDLVREIRIEPETFRLVLINSKGKSLVANKLSAGERQLLAVAILWGLAKASGRPLPTVIDTPLGRLDTQHRENLIKYYFPKASHQVILLSTDTEIVSEYYKKLKPSVNHAYRIDFDEQLGSSHISSGYFS
jgi:DNA sulfur modification protein DndD